MTNVSTGRPGSARRVSVDAYRGFVMFLILAAGIGPALLQAFPGSALGQAIARQQTHAAWVGCTLHDLIMPGFAFLVGVALTLSLARRRGEGQDLKALWEHALTRAVLLFLLGVFLFSLHRVPFVFVDTLTQIGLAYLPVFLLSFRSTRVLWIAFVTILCGVWLAFAAFPLPGDVIDPSVSNVTPEWLQEHGLQGFAAHWQKNLNVAWAFDRWFLNRWPREHVFTGMGDGLATLNFVPLIATMILGVIAARILQGEQTSQGKIGRLVGYGLAGLFCGWALGALGVCPVVKSLWTPAWVLFSGGWCLVFLALFHALGDVWNLNRLLFPLIVIGRNSLVVYCFAASQSILAPDLFKHILGSRLSMALGPSFQPLVYELFSLGVIWSLLYLMNRFSLYVRV